MVFLHEYQTKRLLFFTSFLMQSNFFYFSFDTIYYIAFYTLVAPNITFNFHWCCMLQSFLCVLRLLYPFYLFYRYSGCHAKIGNFNAEKSMRPILPLNKNYSRTFLEPKNYLEVPKWQDNSWSGILLQVFLCLRLGRRKYRRLTEWVAPGPSQVHKITSRDTPPEYRLPNPRVHRGFFRHFPRLKSQHGRLLVVQKAVCEFQLLVILTSSNRHASHHR